MSVEEEKGKAFLREEKRQNHILNQLKTELYTDIHLDFLTSVFYMLFKSMILGANGTNEQMDSIISEWEKAIRPKYIHIPMAVSKTHKIDLDKSKKLMEDVMKEVIDMITENTRIDQVENEQHNEIILLNPDLKLNNK